MNNKDCSIIVSSFDGFSDVWDPFFTLFFRHWPDCPFPIYLITNNKEYPDNRVISLKLGDDQGWSTNLINSLNKIDSNYVIYLQEDYFLSEKVDNDKIIEALDITKNENAAYFHLRPRGNVPYKEYENIKEIPKTTPYLNSTQASIWDKETLLSILKEGETGWEFELKGGLQRARKLDKLFLSSTNLLLPYFATAINRGKYQIDAIKFAKGQGIELDLKKRGRESYYRYFLRRSFLMTLILKIKKDGK